MPAPDREAWPLQPMDLTEKFEAVANCSDSPLKAAVGGDRGDHLAASEATTPAGSSKRAKGPGSASARGSCEALGSLWQEIDSSQSQATDTPRTKRSLGRGAKRKPAAAPKVKAAASPKAAAKRGRGAGAPKAKAKAKAKAASKPLARPAAKVMKRT
ncbi:unnamed protein product [Cladocopium goreaui]|uniref:Uncharacterized protein n=1 Tax=Cladocopium goreaui TaxID=2562237 RepID=A0A9P1DQF8_9DINO|nr:unnamed protein product [Cladocopium goreaui]